LYTNTDEVLFSEQRPILLNGIEELATRTDLIDRSVLLELPVIRKYRSEAEFWKAFEAVQPRLLGALLDLAVQILQGLPKVELTEQLRMADFAKLGTAAEPALGLPRGSFLRAYDHNRKNAHNVALEASPIANLVADLAKEGWEGTASSLLSELARMADDEIKRRKGWPKSPRVLSGMVKRLSTALRTSGVSIKHERDGTPNRNKLISIRRVEKKAEKQQAD
jgi:hypothetical protein